MLKTKLKWRVPCSDVQIQNCMFKTGKERRHVITETESFDSPAFPVQLLDTTAAGNAFNAAFHYKYLKQAPLQRMPLLCV